MIRCIAFLFIFHSFSYSTPSHLIYSGVLSEVCRPAHRSMSTGRSRNSSDDKNIYRLACLKNLLENVAPMTNHSNAQALDLLSMPHQTMLNAAFLPADPQPVLTDLTPI